MAKKIPYNWDVECEVVEQAIADDVFIHDALAELFETMERSDREKAARKLLAAIPMNPELRGE